MVGIELVADRASRRRRSPREHQATERVLAAARDAGSAPVLEHGSRRRRRRSGDARTAVRDRRRRVRADRRAHRRGDRRPSERRERHRRSRPVPEARDLRPRPPASAPSATRPLHVALISACGLLGAPERLPLALPRGVRRRARARARRTRTSTRPSGPGTARRGPGAGSGSGPATTRSSRTCTRRARSWRAPRSSPPRPSATAPSCTRSTPREACITRCRRGRRGSACTTIPRSRSRGCSTTGVQPIAYVDVDVHHGDGVQAIFYEDPRVLTVSIHQSGETLFPGTGFVDERGAGDAEGTAVNVPLQPGVGRPRPGSRPSPRSCRRSCGRSRRRSS